MGELYIKTNESGNVVEASIQALEGAALVEATEAQIDEIMFERKDAVVSSGAIESTTEGEDFIERQAVLAKRAEANLPPE